MGSSQVQGPLWGAEARVWSRTLEAATRPLFEQVHDELGVGNGIELLDAGCGAGLALRLAADRGAAIAGLDAAPGMVAIARERNPDAVIREGDLEELPFEDDRFDAVTAFNSVQYAADPAAALGEIRRVAIPGAPVAVATWAEAVDCETRTVLAAIGGVLPPPPPGAGGPFALSSPGALEDLVGEAGLVVRRSGAAAVEFAFGSLDAAVRAHLSAGPAQRAIGHSGREATAHAIRGALASSVRPDGASVQRNSFRYLIATA